MRPRGMLVGMDRMLSTLRGLLVIWILLYPIICLLLGFASSRSHGSLVGWIDQYPIIWVLALAGYVGPLVLFGWMHRQRKKSRYSHLLRVAHQKSIFHRAEIESSQKCGCFYCKAIFLPDQITVWTDTSKPYAQQTALCPICGIDSVIGDRSGFEITERFLEDMNKVWFGGKAPK